MYYEKMMASDTVERPKRNRRPPIKHTTFYTVMAANKRQIKKARSAVAKETVSQLSIKHNKVSLKSSLRRSRRTADIKSIAPNTRRNGRVEKSNETSDTEKSLPSTRKVNLAQKDKENEISFHPSKKSPRVNSLSQSSETHSSCTSLSGKRKSALKSKCYTGCTRGGASLIHKKLDRVPLKRHISFEPPSSDGGKISSTQAKRPRRGCSSFEENGKRNVGSECVCGKRSREMGKTECDMCKMDRHYQLAYPKVPLRVCRVHLSQCSSYLDDRQIKHAKRKGSLHSTTKPVSKTAHDVGQRLGKIGTYRLRKQEKLSNQNASRKSNKSGKVLSEPSCQRRQFMSLRDRNQKIRKIAKRKIIQKPKGVNRKKVYSCRKCKLYCSNNIQKLIHEFGHANKKVLTIVLERYVPRDIGIIGEESVQGLNVTNESVECNEVKCVTDLTMEATNSQSIEVTSMSNDIDNLLVVSDNSQQMVSNKDKCDADINSVCVTEPPCINAMPDVSETNVFSASVLESNAKEENVINEYKSNKEGVHQSDEKDDSCLTVMNGTDCSSEENAIFSGVTVINADIKTDTSKEADVDAMMEKIFAENSRTSNDEMTAGCSEGETGHVNNTPQISSSLDTSVSKEDNERQEGGDSVHSVECEDICKSSSREDSPGTLCIDETIDEARAELPSLESLSLTADVNRAASPYVHIVNGESLDADSSKVQSCHNVEIANESHKHQVPDSLVASVVAENCNVGESSPPSNAHNTLLACNNQNSCQDNSDNTHTTENLQETLPDTSLHGTCSNDSPPAENYIIPSESLQGDTQLIQQKSDASCEVLQECTPGTEVPKSDVACPEQEKQLTYSDAPDRKVANYSGESRKILEQDLSDISSDGFDIDDDAENDVQDTGNDSSFSKARLSPCSEVPTASPLVGGCGSCQSGASTAVSAEQGKVNGDELCKQHSQQASQETLPLSSETTPRTSPPMLLSISALNKSYGQFNNK